jgi:hypothetical protein
MSVRLYDVAAPQVPTDFDALGDHDRNGTIFALGENEAALPAVEDGWPDPFPDPGEPAELMPQPDPLVRPRRLRIHVGDLADLRGGEEGANAHGARRRAGRCTVDGSGDMPAGRRRALRRRPRAR